MAEVRVKYSYVSIDEQGKRTARTEEKVITIVGDDNPATITAEEAKAALDAINMLRQEMGRHYVANGTILSVSVDGVDMTEERLVELFKGAGICYAGNGTGNMACHYADRVVQCTNGVCLVREGQKGLAPIEFHQ